MHCAREVGRLCCVQMLLYVKLVNSTLLCYIINRREETYTLLCFPCDTQYRKDMLYEKSAHSGLYIYIHHLFALWCYQVSLSRELPVLLKLLFYTENQQYLGKSILGNLRFRIACIEYVTNMNCMK